MSQTIDECYKVHLLDIFRGDDAAYKGCIVDTSEQPVNISGWTFRTLVKNHYRQADSAAIANIVTGPLFDLDAKQGEFYIWFRGSMTSTMNAHKYYMDIRLENNGVTQTLIRGSINIIGEVKWVKGTHE